MVRDHDDQDVGGPGAVPGRGGGGGALGGESEEGWGVDIVADDGVAGAEEVGGHGVAHGAEAGEEEGGGGDGGGHFEMVWGGVRGGKREMGNRGGNLGGRYPIVGCCWE